MTIDSIHDVPSASLADIVADWTEYMASHCVEPQAAYVYQRRGTQAARQVEALVAVAAAAAQRLAHQYGADWRTDSPIRWKQDDLDLRDALLAAEAAGALPPGDAAEA